MTLTPERIAVGDAVSKTAGYPFDGVVLALYDDGKPKAVVQHRDGWQHIFAVSQLARQQRPESGEAAVERLTEKDVALKAAP